MRKLYIFILLFKFLNCEIIENDNIKIKTQEDGFIKKLIKKQKFYNIYEQGHDLSKLNEIKEGMSLSEVKKILGTPISTKKLKNTYFYMNQTFSRTILGCKFKKGKIVRLYFKNNKLARIKEINMKKSLLIFPEEHNIETNIKKTYVEEQKISPNKKTKCKK